MKKNTKRSSRTAEKSARRAQVIRRATLTRDRAAPTIAELAQMDPREGFTTAPAPRLYAEQVRAHGPVYRGRGILPGWAIAMTTGEGTPVSRVYKVFGSIKARVLALALCRQHRLPLTFAEVNG